MNTKDVPQRVDCARVIRVIEVRSLRGQGIDLSDPVRQIIEYWTLDGKLLASVDEWAAEQDKIIPKPETKR